MTPTTITAADAAELLDDRLVTLQVSFHLMTDERKVSTDTITTDADKDRLRVAAKLLDCPERKLLTTIAGKVHTTIRSRFAVPSLLQQGAHAIPVALAVEVDEYLTTMEAGEWATAIASFIEIYPAARDISREALGPLFDESVFPEPEDVLDLFDMEWLWMSAPSAPQNDRLPPALANRIARDLATQTAELVGTIEGALLAEMRDLSSETARRLATRADGKRPRVREDHMPKITEALRLIEARNVTGSSDVAMLSMQMRSIISGRGGASSLTASLRDGDALREAVVADFDGVNRAIAAAITDGPTRRMVS